MMQEATAVEGERPDDVSVDPPGLDVPRDKDGSGCQPPPDCRDIRTSGFNANACCTKEVACGLDLSPVLDGLKNPESGIPAALAKILISQMLPEVDLSKPCAPPAKLWAPTPSQADRRVPGGAPDGDVLLTSKCPSRMVLGIPFFGCCMKSDQCGYSTHIVQPDLLTFSTVPGQFEHAQCLDAAELNRLGRNTAIALLIGAPDLKGSCGYAALDARLPPVPPPVD